MGVMVMAGTQKGVFILESGNRKSWKVRGPYLKGWAAYALAADTRGSKPVLWAGLSSDVYGAHLQRSDDAGQTWTPVAENPAFPEGSERKLRRIWSLRPQGQQGLLCGVAEAALFESDGTDGWRLNQGLEGHPTRPGWLPGAGGLCLHTILPDPKDPKRLFIGISAVGVFRSDDGGRSWQVKNEGVTPVPFQEEPKYSEINRCVHKLVQDPKDPKRLYQQNHLGVFRSADGGDSWERIENGLRSPSFGFPMVVHPHDPRTLYVVPQESDEFRMFVGGRLTVYRSRDRGDSWQPLTRGLEKENYSGALRDAMAVDHADPAGVYVGTSSGQIFASADEGESWGQLPGVFPRVLKLEVLNT
ncbi:MAG TPA: hypothetical protein VK131_00370 [Candidatus Acidoferrales bacterium]|nr:hypothetical protein [Candidatus Acidoferrales bacterium]